MIAPTILMAAPRAAASDDTSVSQVRLVAREAVDGDELGAAVATSGRFIVLGAPYANETGAAYVYERRGQPAAWVEVAKLVGSDSASYDLFGRSVAMTGDTIAVGAPLHQEAAGAAYIFRRNAGAPGNWGEVAKLTASDGAAGDEFGVSLSIDGARLVVGSHQDDDRGEESGSAYVYERSAGGSNVWVETAKLAAGGGRLLDHFGCAVSISRTTIVVGAHAADGRESNSGAVFVFERRLDGSGWTQQAKLSPRDAEPFDFFGMSVAIHGGAIVVGAPFEDRFEPGGDGESAGAVYVFLRSSSEHLWDEVAKIVAPDANPFDAFGFSVAIRGSRVVVGATGSDPRGMDSGAAYVFQRNERGGLWHLVSKLSASDGRRFDRIGSSVASSGNRVVVGEGNLQGPGRRIGEDEGSAYVFEIRTRSNAQPRRVVPRGAPTVPVGAR